MLRSAVGRAQATVALVAAATHVGHGAVASDGRGGVSAIGGCARLGGVHAVASQEVVLAPSRMVSVNALSSSPDGRREPWHLPQGGNLSVESKQTKAASVSPLGSSPCGQSADSSDGEDAPPNKIARRLDLHVLRRIPSSPSGRCAPSTSWESLPLRFPSVAWWCQPAKNAFAPIYEERMQQVTGIQRTPTPIGTGRR